MILYNNREFSQISILMQHTAVNPLPFAFLMVFLHQIVKYMKKYAPLSLPAFCTAIILSLMVSLSSCSKNDTADTTDLLSSIPSDVSVVATANLKAILEDMGCKVEGTSVKPGKDAISAFEAAKNKNLEKFLDYIYDGGVDPSVAAFFMEGYNAYIAGFLDDPDKFKAKVEKDFGETFSGDGKIATCGNVAVEGNRFWIAVSSENTIVTSDIKHFSTLSEKQSILSNKTAAETLKTLDNDITAWGDIKGCLNAAGLDFSTKAAANMAIEGMFADASDMVANLDFEKGRMSAEMTVLNSKGGIAKFMFPTGKIQADAIKKLNASGDALFAIAITPEMVKQLQEQTKSQGVSMMGMVASLISSLDGTCVYAGDNNKNVAGFLSTTGSGTASLSDLISQYGYKVTKDDKLLRFSQGSPSGPISAEQAAEQLKGSAAGLLLSGDLFDGNEKSDLSMLSVTLDPDKGGMLFKVALYSQDSKKNIILSLII